jgi:uncharacterized membrane protein YphA (DoxX/SURF4 family)
MKKFAPLILRIGLAFVFLWFGTNQLLSQSMWLSLIPAWAVSLTGMTAKTLVMINGTFEIIAGALLAVGVWIRPVAFLLAIHLLMIIGDVGLSPIGIRDIGLFCAALSVFFQGADEYSLDKIPSSVPNQI